MVSGPSNRLELRVALNQLKKDKAPGEDRITSELLKADGTPILKFLQKFFNSVIVKGEAWSMGMVVLFCKKGDHNRLNNYRPNALLSHV